MKTKIILVAVALSVSGKAAAQADANATAKAGDAFGYTVGTDTVGIYDQSSVRGFDLEAAGNYRFEDRYFVKSSGVSSFFIQSATVRIGYTTILSSLPGPSGVVDYKLRDPVRGEKSLITAGLDEHEQKTLDLHVKHRAPDNAFSVSAGLGLVFSGHDAQGGDQKSWLLGGTARVNLGESGQMRVFAGEYDYWRDGRFRIIPESDTLPARIKRGTYIGQDWMRAKGQRRIAGILLDQGVGDNWSLGANITYSQEDPTRNFTQFLSKVKADGTAQSMAIYSPQQRATALSGEIRATWATDIDRASHKLVIFGRGRQSDALFGGDRTIALGPVNVYQGPTQLPAPDLTGARANLQNDVDQWGLGLSYQLGWRDKVRLNVGLLRTRYIKKFSSTAQSSRNESDPMLYNVGLIFRPTEALEIYGSYSRGLEEAGTAPASAANRNAVLNAIIVRQKELGMRVALGRDLGLVVAGFDTRKPYAGIDPSTSVFGLVGDVRHKGVEFSLAGNPVQGLSIIAGGVYLQPKRTGGLVDLGQAGPRPVGVPDWKLLGNASYDLPFVQGVTVDGGIKFSGRSPASSRLIPATGKQLMLPSSLTADVGLRYSFSLAGRPVTARAQVLNLFDNYAFIANSSETLDYSPQRRFKLLVTAQF